MKIILGLFVLSYLLIGLCWVLRNHDSRWATEDRATWRRQREWWKFVVIPGVVALLWPLAALLVWRIKRVMETGEFDLVVHQVVKEHMEKKHIDTNGGNK